MKKLFKALCMMAVVFTAVSCIDEDGIWNKIKDLENQVKDVNAVLNELKKGDRVTSMSQTAGGFIITLSSGQTLAVAMPNNNVIVDKIDGVACFELGETQGFAYAPAGAVVQSVLAPNGWSAKYEDGNVVVKAPYSLGNAALKGSVVILSAVTDGNDVKMSFATKDVKTLYSKLTFENEDFTGTITDVKSLVGWTPAGASATGYWSSLIDDKQYGGSLLYGEADEYYSYNSPYCWVDAGNTYLAMTGFGTYWGSVSFGSGGQAVSNLSSIDSAGKIDFEGTSYLSQLEVPFKDAYTGKGGHDGSRNFGIHFGHSGEYPLVFADKKARTIVEMYVGVTSYLANSVVNGDGFFGPLSGDSYVAVSIKGYDSEGKETGTIVYKLVDGNKAAAVAAGKDAFGWERVELSSLGKVSKVTFRVVGSEDCYGEWGFNAPGYFAFDDVLVKE